MMRTTKQLELRPRMLACLALAAGMAAIASTGCRTATHRNESSGGAAAQGAADPAGRAAPGGGAEMAPDGLATVDRLLVAQQIAPSESLAVRLVGAVGPDGSWALDRIEVQQSPGRIALLPHVRRVAGDSFIQMVIPLDRTVRVALPAGRYRVEARGRTGVVGSEVVVAENARREPPRAYVEVQTETPVGEEVVVTLRLEGRVADGFVDRLEVREQTGDAPGDWRGPDSVERTAKGLLGSVSIRRPAGDPQHRVEVRARDGQGTWSPAVGSVLQAR